MINNLQGSFRKLEVDWRHTHYHKLLSLF
jgi:hypothetical protein